MQNTLKIVSEYFALKAYQIWRPQGDSNPCCRRERANFGKPLCGFRPFYTIFLVLPIIYACQPQAQEPIIILSRGQSNAGIKVRGSCAEQIPERFCKPIYGVRFYTLVRGSYVIRQNVGMGPATVLAHCLRKTTGRQIEIWHEQHGGKGIKCWTEGCVSKGVEYGPFKTNLLKAPKKDGFIIDFWIHGEKDMNSMESASNYLERRMALHRYTERVLGKVDLVVATEPGKGFGRWRNRLLREHKGFVNRVGGIYLPADNWELKDDQKHYTLLSKVKMGVEACEAVLTHIGY